MSKKIVSLTAEQASVVRYAVFDGPGWGDERAQWRQICLMDKLDALPQAGPIELETTSGDRRLLIRALQSPQLAGMSRGRFMRDVWSTKIALGWKQPDPEDLDDDDEGDE